MTSKSRLAISIAVVLLAGMLGAQEKVAKAGAPGVLSAAEVKAALPEQVFFRGQKAPVQLRNAAGVRFGDEKLVLVTLVDNSGYSSGIAEKYQAYFITEVKLKFGGQELAPGAYGCGMVGGKFLVMDLAADDLFSVPEENDTEMKRARPLTITSNEGNYRLYFGKKYVTFSAGQ